MKRLTALVTGSTRGIGREIAVRLAERGVRVIAHGRTPTASAQAFVRGLPGDGHLLVTAELAEPDSVMEAWQDARSRAGSIDILVNNAGVFSYHPPLTSSFDEWTRAWEQAVSVNLLAPAHLSFAAAQDMAAQGGGRIVNISSRGAFRGEPKAPAYGASKAGLNALSQSLAKALAPQAVYVFVVAPGWVETEMSAAHLNGPERESILRNQPMGRVTSAREVADAVTFCALDAPAAMTGAILDVNGASYLRT
jgi:NAD(P)-dependent dehydrogenase (short-subunit alcohol dehydrogenase family)